MQCFRMNKSVKWIIQWLTKTVTCFIHEYISVYQLLLINYIESYCYETVKQVLDHFRKF